MENICRQSDNNSLVESVLKHLKSDRDISLFSDVLPIFLLDVDDHFMNLVHDGLAPMLGVVNFLD